MNIRLLSCLVCFVISIYSSFIMQKGEKKPTIVKRKSCYFIVAPLHVITHYLDFISRYASFYHDFHLTKNGETRLLSHEMVTRPNSSSSCPWGIPFTSILSMFSVSHLVIKDLNSFCTCHQVV